MDAESLDTDATPGTLAALPEDGLTSDQGWRSHRRNHLGNKGKLTSVPRRGDAKSIPVHPWVADCDKNDARPLNMATIDVLVRATGEMPRRAVQRQYALPHKNATVVAKGESNSLGVDIAPIHAAPSGKLAADHGFGGQRSRARGQSFCWADAGSTRTWTESRYPASR